MAAASKTRVCIKNLPPTATAQDIKEFLKESSSSSQSKIEITDCKLLKNAKGKSRKVAFVGFKQESQAKYVVDRFHRTYMRMSRISVEPALAKQDEKETKVEAKESKSKKPEEKSTSRHKKEIMDIVGSSSGKSKFWANDGDMAAPVAETDTRSPDVEASSDSSDSDSSDDSDTEESVAEEAVQKDAKMSDMDFLRSKQKSTDDLENEDDRQKDMDTDSDSSDSESSDDSDSDNDEVEKEDPKGQLSTPTEDAIADSENDEGDENETAKREELSQSRLFVRNLPFETTEEELEEYFSAYGGLIECHIPVDDQKRNKGFAFVQFASAIDALTARKELDKVDFQGRLLHILPARPAVSTSGDGNENLTWKQRQERARKEKDTNTNGEGAKGWSASFVRGDAVVDNLADRLGLRKGDLLGVKDKLSSGDAAVRLALGETKIIEENREYFREHGIDMEALVSLKGDEKTTKRSKTSFLVKNLPYDTRVEELQKLFQIGGESINILLPPSRTIALVEYEQSTDAKRAFRKLAYRRFKHVPIYLEWAPEAARTGTSKATDSTTKPAVDSRQILEQDLKDDDEHEVEVHGGASSTIYIKNLNFATNEDAVRQVFEKHIGTVLSVRIPQKVAPSKNSGEEPQLLSMGYGFVELASESATQKAIQMLQGKMVDGHAWELTVSSNRKGASQSQKSQLSGKKSSKLIVRNVPFQATRKEILKLFGSFGQLRRVRLPKKFDGTHRGFAFVDFLTHKEAAAAMNALSRTHLYGRHLVLEWAQDGDDDVDRLRDKAQRDSAGLAPPNKKIRFT